MKFVPIALLLVWLTGCSTVGHRDSVYYPATPNEPDPVLIIYHVKPGAEKELENLLKSTWEVYRKEGLVYDKPHICVRVNEDRERVRYVEVFTWVGIFATEYPPDSVKQLWAQIQALCEMREGNPGIEFRTAGILMP